MKKGLTLDSKAEKILFLTQLHFSMGLLDSPLLYHVSA